MINDNISSKWILIIQVIIIVVLFCISGYGLMEKQTYDKTTDKYRKTDNVQINSLEIKNVDGGDYRPQIIYTYRANDAVYRNIDLDDARSGYGTWEIFPSGSKSEFNKSTVEKMVDPKNEELNTVYYNPENPKKSYILKGEQKFSYIFIGLVNVIILLISILLFRKGYDKIRQKTRISNTVRSDAVDATKENMEIGIDGNIRSKDNMSIPTPVNNKKAVVVYYELEQYYKRTPLHPGVWSHITHDVEFIPFRIKDNTGSVTFIPSDNTDFDFNNTNKIRWDGNGIDNIPDSVYSFMDGADVLNPDFVNTDSIRFKDKYRLKEKVIYLGEDAFVYGVTKSSDNVSYDDDSTDIFISDKDDINTIVSAGQSKDDVISNNKKLGYVYIILSILSFILVSFIHLTWFGFI